MNGKSVDINALGICEQWVSQLGIWTETKPTEDFNLGSWRIKVSWPRTYII